MNAGKVSMKRRVVKWFTCSQSISGYKGKEMPHLGYSNCARPFTQGSRYFHHEHLCSKHLCYKPFHYIINWPWYNSAIKDKITENKRRTLKICNETWKINSKIKKKKLYSKIENIWIHLKWVYIDGKTAQVTDFI